MDKRAAVEKQIVDEYLKGAGTQEVQRKFRVRNQVVTDTLKKHGVDTEAFRAKRISAKNLGKTHPGVVARSQSINHNISSGEWGYIAGIFDGEGSLCPDRTGNLYRISIAQNGLALHQWLKDTLGVGRIQMSRAGKANHFIIAPQKQVWEFLVKVAPHCIVKSSTISQGIQRIGDRYDF